MRRLFLLCLLLISAIAKGQSFDTPGEDPTWHQSQPNDYARLKQNNGIYPASTPNRTEYYLPLSGGSSYTVTATWNLVNDGLTISDRFYTPNQWLVGIPRLHAKGLIGTGVKIVLIGDGYSNSAPHVNIGAIAGSTGSITYQHDAQVLGTMAAKSTGKLVGGCYGASFYSRAATNVSGDIDYARGIGAKIICLSHDYGSVTDATKTAIRAFNRSGGVIIVAAGNGGTLGAMQSICGEPGVVCVGATVGGTVLSFQDAWYSRKIQAVSGSKTVDFALPAYTTGLAFNDLDGSGASAGGNTHSTYTNISNSSFTESQVAACFALCMQRFPTLSAKMIFYMLRRNSRSFTQDGVTAFIPNLNFIR